MRFADIVGATAKPKLSAELVQGLVVPNVVFDGVFGENILVLPLPAQGL